MTCERCLHPVEVGEHGLYLCPLESRVRAAGVKPDTLLGGFVAENAWREPRYFDSQKRYERALDASGLMLKPRRVAGDRAIDAQTLENARRLVLRTKSVPIAERVLDESLTVQAES